MISQSSAARTQSFPRVVSKAVLMAESCAFTLYLTTGSHTVSADVAAIVLGAIATGELMITIPVDSLIDDDSECELTLSTQHVVGVLSSRPKSEPSFPTGNGVLRLRVATIG